MTRSPLLRLLRPLPRLFLVVASLGIAGCSTIAQAPAPTVDKNALWVVAPFANHTETPLAGARAAAIGEALLVSQGAGKVRRFESTSPESPFETAPAKARHEALAFARKVKGSVDFDVNPRLIEELRRFVDKNGEESEVSLRDAALVVTADTPALADRTFFIVAVPTPIDEHRRPDLTPLVRASIVEILDLGLLHGLLEGHLMQQHIGEFRESSPTSALKRSESADGACDRPCNPWHVSA